MALYIEKKVVVEAAPFKYGAEDGFEWYDNLPKTEDPVTRTSDRLYWAYINTPRGRQVISIGDWIIQYPDGSKESMPGPIFNQRYVPQGDDPQADDEAKHKFRTIAHSEAQILADSIGEFSKALKVLEKTVQDKIEGMGKQIKALEVIVFSVNKDIAEEPDKDTESLVKDKKAKKSKSKDATPD